MTTEVINEMKQFQLFVPFEKQHPIDFDKNFSKSYAENPDGFETNILQ